MIHPKKLTADDRAEINELFGKYAWAGDTGDVEGYVALFTEDGVFDGVSGYYDGRAGPDAAGRGDQGRAALARAAALGRQLGLRGHRRPLRREVDVLRAAPHRERALDRVRRLLRRHVREGRRRVEVQDPPLAPVGRPGVDGAKPWETGEADGGWIHTHGEGSKRPSL